MHLLHNIMGQSFGRWTAIKRVKISGSKDTMFLCRCKCGVEKIKPSYELRSGKSKSCGCLHHDKMTERLTTHGLSRHRIYGVWKSMRRRCHNHKDQAYKNYGGRGISVCDRWQKFENFFADMGMPPTGKHTLERKNNNGNYEPKNCKWALRKEQQNNMRSNQIIELNGQKKTIAQWSAETDIKQCTLYSRLYRGWTIDKIFSPIASQTKAN